LYGTERIDIAEQIDRSLIGADEDRDLELWVWEYPYLERDEVGTLIRRPSFVVAVDVSEGLEDGDRTAVTVMDANNWEEVASFVGHLNYEDVGPLAEWLGYWYYTALILVERNNQGLVPLQYLTLNAYPRLYRMDTIAQQRRGDRTPRYGWHTNKSTKPKMVIDLAKAVRDEIIIFRDNRFLQEARTFLSDGKGGYGASSGNHDDKVMANCMAWQGCLDIGQYPLVWQDYEDRPLTFGEFFAELDYKEPTMSPLYKPIGQGERRGETVKRGFIMHPSNVR
jgi:hypothetical protein